MFVTLRKRNESESERAWHYEVDGRLQSFPVASTLTVVAIVAIVGWQLDCLQHGFAEP
jgi:hypothetical protein